MCSKHEPIWKLSANLKYVQMISFYFNFIYIYKNNQNNNNEEEAEEDTTIIKCL